jgi:hypothetical protein
MTTLSKACKEETHEEGLSRLLKGTNYSHYSGWNPQMERLSLVNTNAREARGGAPFAVRR